MNDSASDSNKKRQGWTGNSSSEPAVAHLSAQPRRSQTRVNCKAVAVGRCTAPELWQQIDLVSGLLRTRAPELTLIVSGSEISVFGQAAALGRATSRGLVLGHRALERLTITELHAVLAHEFAHFAQEESLQGRALFALQTALNGCSNLFRGRGFLSRSLRQTLSGQIRLNQSLARHRELEADRLAARLFGATAMCRALEGLIQCYLEAHSRNDADAINTSGATSPVASGIVSELRSRTHPAVRERIDRLYELPAAGALALPEDYRSACRLVPAEVLRIVAHFEI